MTLNEVRTISWISLGSVAFERRGNVFRRLGRVGERLVDVASFLQNRPLNIVTTIVSVYEDERLLE